MGKKNKKSNIKSSKFESFNYIKIGDSVAEYDTDLKDCFIENIDYKKIIDLRDSSAILVGERGTGKSAILEKIKLDNNSKKIVTISNKDLNIFLAQKELAKFFSDEEFEKKRILFKILWLYIICASVLSKIFNNKKWWDRQTTKLFDEKFKELNKFFQITKTDTPINFSITFAMKLFEQVRGGINASVGVELLKKELDTSQKLENLMKFMDDFIKDLDSYIEHEMYVLIDDLDDSWDSSEFAKLYLEGLIESLCHFNKKSKVKVIATLLESVINSINFKSYGKILSRCRYLRWNSVKCEQLITKRLNHHNIKNLSEIFSTNVSFNDIYKKTIGTPRDIIQLFQIILELCSEKKAKLNSNDLNIISHGFSKNKLNEFLKDRVELNYYCLKPLTDKLTGTKMLYSYNELNSLLKELCLEYATKDNLSSKHKYLKSYVDNEENIDAFIAFLYSIGFIGYNTHSSKSTAVYFNEDPDHKVNKDFNYMIRPVYAKALSINK